MKCPMCGGDTLNDLVVKGKMTNEEWFNTLSTEDKARFFADNDGTIQIGDDIDHKNTVMRWEKWLKEKHESEEK